MDKAYVLEKKASLHTARSCSYVFLYFISVLFACVLLLWFCYLTQSVSSCIWQFMSSVWRCLLMLLPLLLLLTEYIQFIGCVCACIWTKWMNWCALLFRQQMALIKHRRHSLLTWNRIGRYYWFEHIRYINNKWRSRQCLSKIAVQSK